MSARSRQRRQENVQSESQAPKQKLNFNLRRIEPLTKNQELAFRYRNEHQLLYGVAGTGKSFLALYHALDDVIEKNLYKKIILIRSATQGRKMGFMPGNEKEKMAYFESPYIEICTKLFGRGDAYEILKQKNIIEFMSTSFLRGITLDECVVIVDEFQNMDRWECESVLTRLGENSRVVICGDCRQDDIIRNRERTGARDIIKIVQKMDCFSFVEFTFDDIVRSEFVKQYILAAVSLEKQGLIETI